MFDPADVLVFSMHTPFFINDTLVCPHVPMLCVEESMSEGGYGAFSHGVDLRLAENYLPGCVCLLKGGLLVCCLYLVEWSVSPIFFIVLGLCLGFDRVWEAGRILDGNALLWCAYASHIVRYAASLHRDSGVVVPTMCIRGVYVIWFGVAGVFVYPGGVGSLFACCDGTTGDAADSSHGWLSKWTSDARETRTVSRLYLAFTGVCVCVILFGQEQGHQSLEFECGQVVVYLILSVVWVYTVGLHGPRCCLVGVDGSVTLVPLFAVILYLPLPMGATFFLWSVWCVACGNRSARHALSRAGNTRDMAPPSVTPAVSAAGRLTDFGLDMRKGGGILAPAGRLCDAEELVGNRSGSKQASCESSLEQGEYEDVAEQFRQAKENSLKRA